MYRHFVLFDHGTWVIGYIDHWQSQAISDTIFSFFDMLLLGILIIQAAINLVGALGPELGLMPCGITLPSQNLASSKQNYFLRRGLLLQWFTKTY